MSQYGMALGWGDIAMTPLQRDGTNLKAREARGPAMMLERVSDSIGILFICLFVCLHKFWSAKSPYCFHKSQCTY